MKLKNSYILLIAIALFLLVSIGSVCASDNVTNQLATQMDNSGSDIIAVDDANDNSIISEGETGGNAGNGSEPEKINTTVTSNDVEVGKDDPIEIPVTVKDNESNVMTIEKANITVTENNKTINFNYNNSIINITDKLSVGNHSLIINYLGNDLYRNSTTSILVSIFGDMTLDAPSVVASDGETVAIPLVISDGVREYTVDASKLTLNLTCVDELGNTTSRLIDDFNIENNTVRFLLDNLKFVSAYVNVTYTDGVASSKKVALKYATKVNAEGAKFNESDNKTIPVSVLFGENPLNITKNDLKVLENGADVAFEYNNSVITINSLKAGNHTITIKYLGNDTYGESNKTILISVYGNVVINAVTAINVNSSRQGIITISNITNGVDVFSFNLDDLNVTASYKSGNDTIATKVNVIKLENSTLYVEFENLTFTTATLSISYRNITSANVTVNRIYNAQIVVVKGKNQYQNGAFTFKLVDLDDNTTVISGKTVTLYTIGNIRAGFSATTNSEGIATFYTKNLYEFDNANNAFTMRQFEVGNHSVELSTSGDVKTSTLKVNLTITQAQIKIVITNLKAEYGSDKNVTITVTNKNDGAPVPGIILRLYMPQTSGKNYYFQTDSNGQSKVSVKQLISGTYSITVCNNDTKNIKYTKVSANLVITPKVAVLTAQNRVVLYNCGKTAIIKVTEKKTGKALSGIYVAVQIFTGKKFSTYVFQTNNKGLITFSASLGVGKHKMIIQTADTRYKASSLVRYVTVKKAAAKFVAPKVISYYRGGKYFTVKLLNAKNQPIYDAKVKINGKYTGNTAVNGELKLSFDTLAPGTYKVIVSAGDTQNYTAKAVTSYIVVKKAPTVIGAANVVAKKGANKYFKIVVKNAKTKKIIPGVKLKVAIYTGKTYKTYNVYANSKGIAQINVKSLSVGTHKVVIASANKYCSAKVKAAYIKITK